MKTYTVDNGLGSREREHANLLLCPNQGIVAFTGKDIPPVLKVLKEAYEKNGKWSKWIWTVEVEEGYEFVTFGEDFGTGKYFPVKTWKEAIEHLNLKLRGQPRKMGITDEMMERAIRSIFKDSAKKLDASETEFREAGNVLQQLLDAQMEFASVKKEEAVVKHKIAQIEEAERLLQEAAEIKERVGKANQLLSQKGKINLAELKQLMEN